MPFEKYQDLHPLKEKNFHRVDPRKSTVIFMDCRDITKSKEYDLIYSDPIYNYLADSALEVASDMGFDCTIYAGIDEVSIIFPTPSMLKKAFGVGDCADYILSLYMQRFLQKFWQSYPEIYIKGTIFNMARADIKRYIEFRRTVCQSVAMFYIAKRYLPAYKYRKLPFAKKPIANLLKKESFQGDETLFDAVVSNVAFYNGIEMDYFAPRS